MSWGDIDPALLAPAYAAGVLVVATHVPLGRQVLARGIVFIDLAIAQLAAVGVIAAAVLFDVSHGWGVQAAAVAAALLGALLMTALERRWPEVQEALIGVVFILASTLAILLLARNPHGGEHLKDLLVGQILWVTWSDILPLAALYSGVLIVWYGFRQRLGRFGFYALFAVTVTASVQVVGVYLVFATLIVPALAVRCHSRDLPAVAWGYGLGALGYGAGLALSAAFDLPSGALIVWTLALLALLLTPRQRGASRA